jgi:hypothetical protein
MSVVVLSTFSVELLDIFLTCMQAIVFEGVGEVEET